ncbi:MAG: carbohydrate ABC transporter permease [Clostridia bacterium]|nr:carbohydrate ABC transporter permease [Clostridia bacterium]
MKESFSRKAFHVFNYIFMIFLMAVTLYPFIYSLFCSLSSPYDLLAYKGFLYKPIGFSTAAYRAVMLNPDIYSGFSNTLIVLVTTTALQAVLTLVGAYCLTRDDAKLVKYLNMGIIFTMYFSGGIVPQYLNIRSLGMDNSLLALIIPQAMSTYHLIIMKSAFVGVPQSLEESALLDGAGRLTILFKILTPLVLPNLMVIILYAGVHVWNAWFGAMVYLRDRSKFPLQLILREILLLNKTGAEGNTAVGDTQGVAETIQYATMIVTTVPILLVYPFLQKYFVKGVMVGAVKG